MEFGAPSCFCRWQKIALSGPGGLGQRLSRSADAELLHTGTHPGNLPVAKIVDVWMRTWCQTLLAPVARTSMCLVVDLQVLISTLRGHVLHQPMPHSAKAVCESHDTAR